MSKKLTALTGVAGTLLSLAVAPPAAQAAGRDGTCDVGEFCMYYNSDQQGSVSDFTGSLSDYGAATPSCYVFLGAGAGKDLCVKNRAASVWNRTTGPVTVHYNSGFSGPSQTVAAGAKANLSAALKNQNASHQLGVPTDGPRRDMSYALYGLSGGRVSCAFDGYKTLKNSRHEGIDFARGIGSPVHALVKGQVKNVVRGSEGSGGLSIIAIYNRESNRTVIYLHAAPVAGLAVGQQISRGQKIATESWRGVSTAASRHTHVEVRTGVATTAAKSVGDPVLTNPDPTGFWQAQGYNIR